MKFKNGLSLKLIGFMQMGQFFFQVLVFFLQFAEVIPSLMREHHPDLFAHRLRG
jgi:hypothetical protein